MDEPKSPKISFESENESDEELADSNHKWGISYLEEKSFILNRVLGIYSYQNNICPHCHQHKLGFNEAKKDNILIPFFMRCSDKKCKRIYNLRYFSFFGLHNKIPISMLVFIVETFIIIKANAKQLESYLSAKYKSVPSYNTILNILHNIKKAIANYMKDKYPRIQIGGPPEKNKVVAVDECLMTHEHGIQQWVVGAIETDTYRLRIDIIPERNQNNLKIFVNNHIVPGTTIVTDGWAGYRFLDNDDTSVREHQIHNHGAGDFGTDQYSTSHIEHTWNNIKQEIKVIYGSLPNQNFIYFLREAELRLNIAKLSNSEKLDTFRNILRYVYDLNQFYFYDDD